MMSYLPKSRRRRRHSKMKKKSLCSREAQEDERD
jgi:hypothetical protein